MAPPAYQGIGDQENDPWGQPAYGLPFPEDDMTTFANPYMMQPGIGHLDPDGNTSFDNNFYASVIMTQAPGGMGRTPQAPANNIDNFMANGNGSQGHTHANIPRGSVAMEQIQTLFAPPFPMADNNIEPQHPPGNPILAEEGQDESEYVTVARTPHVSKRARKPPSPNPSPEEWERRKLEIHSLYFGKHTLEDTRTEMKDKGFDAEAWMYKKKFSHWGWKTYEHGKGSGNSGGETSTEKSAKRTRGKASSSSSTKISRPNNSRDTTVAVVTPQRNHHTRSNPTHSNMKISALMSDTDFNKLMNTILANTKNLYISYPAQNKWMVKKQREVEEDIHDDLLVGIATSVRNYSTLSPKVGSTGFQKALCTLERVVGVGEGADCGLFSLPVIWVSFLRLVREQKSEDWAWEFLLQALNLALNKFGREHSFVTVLLNLQKIWVKDPGQLEGVILKSYLCCIAHVKEMLGSFNLTYLTLWADYVVYLDGAATNKTNNVVEDIRGVIKVLEEEKGPDGGPDSDYILELLGLMLYVLQSAPTMATMANEAEEVAKDLYRRLERRKKKSGGKLEGDLLIKWKDLRQTLGTLCQERKDYDKAISFLEEFLSYEIADERDALALEKLERCYVAVGRDEKAMEVRELRMNESQRLLQKTDTEPFGGEKVVNDHRERDDEEGEDVSEGKGSSEGTVVGQVEEIQKENPKEYDTNETGDFEVEQQLLREQIAELEKKLHVLETSKGGKL